jgi:integrase
MEAQCPFLDFFENNYEQFWARYKTYMARIKPGKKLGHDRRYLIMVLRRAKKQKIINTDFVKGDFPLQEVSESVGRALEPGEVKKLLETARALKNEKIYQQIKIAVYLGLRKKEILHLSKEEVDLKKREIALDPKRVKTRRRRKVPIPIHDDVFPILKELVEMACGKFLFPKRETAEKGAPVDWEKPQTDLSSVFQRVRDNAGVNCRFHDLRHTAITNMVAAQVPPTTISKIMGCGLDLLNRIYDHLLSKTKDDIRKLDPGRYDF